MRTEREAIVTSSGGTSSARITKNVDGGRLLDVLEEDRPELVDEVEVLEHEDLAGALGRAERRLLHDLPGGGGVDAALGGGRLDDVEVGVGLGQGQPGVALGVLARRCPRTAAARRRPGPRPACRSRTGPTSR